LASRLQILRRVGPNQLMRFAAANSASRRKQSPRDGFAALIWQARANACAAAGSRVSRCRRFFQRGSDLPQRTQAHELARTLGRLAIALAQAQACAYINQQRIGFARYLSLWREKRAVLTWFDQRLASNNHDVGLAATRATSVAALTPGGRRLLELLAFLAPEPVPDSLLDVPLPSPYCICADLTSASYSGNGPCSQAAPTAPIRPDQKTRRSDILQDGPSSSPL
jgi:hypothetical protein